MLVNNFVVRVLAGLIALGASSLGCADPATDAAADAGPANAAEQQRAPDDERARLRERASDLKRQARAIKEKAAADRASADALCWQRTFVSSCIEDADAAHRDSMAAARKLEIEAGDIERDMRTRAAQERRAEKLRTAEERRQKSIEMSVTTRDAEEKKEQKREQDAAQRAEKDAAAAARAQTKAQEAVQRDAELAEKRRREDARAAERAAEQRRHAEKIDERVRKKEEQRLRREAEAAARELKP